MTEVQAKNAEGVLVCPNCGAEDDNFPFIGIEAQGIYDGVLIWSCSRCHHWWPRFRPPGRLYDCAVLLIEMKKGTK